MECSNSENIEPDPDEWRLFPYINNKTIYDYSEVILQSLSLSSSWKYRLNDYSFDYKQ